MADTRRGKKQNYNKNYTAHAEWMTAKKLGRRKQRWVPTHFVEHTGEPVGGYWEKVGQ
jgi:hypothetical protein